MERVLCMERDISLGVEGGRVSDSLHAIVLDFDGVILESNGVKTEAFQDVFSRFPGHADAAMSYHRANAWRSRYDKIDFLLRELGRPDEARLREELAADFSRRTLERLATVPFVPGAPEFLAEFSARIALYVVSVTPQTDLDSTIRDRGLRHYFQDVYGCPPWTKATAVLDVLEHKRYEPSRVVLIGDAPGDRSAAAEAGVEFVARRSEIAFDAPEPRLYDDLFAIAAALRGRLPETPART
jgi:beta-phosphoglucomutase-like phosphatase (HAD superfamily)